MKGEFWEGGVLPPVLPERSSKIGDCWDFGFSFQFLDFGFSFLKDDIFIIYGNVSNIMHRGEIPLTGCEI